MIRLIVGPPGAGKSTLVQGEQGPGDLVIDLDRIRETVPNESTARKLRALLEEKATEHEGGDVWIIRTLADRTAREEFAARVGVDEIRVLDTPAEVAKARVKERDGNTDKFPAIDRWWADYAPDKGAEGEDDMSRTDQEATAEGVQEAAEIHDEQAEQAEQADSKGNQGDGKGWPEDTPVAEMTTEQQLNYWRFHARKHERAAQKLQKELDQAPKEPAGPDPLEVERAEVRREIFDARFDAAASKHHPEHDFVKVKEHLNVESFTGEDGRIDQALVAEFVQSLPSGESKVPGLPGDFGTDTPYEGGSGIEMGRELYRAAHK